MKTFEERIKMVLEDGTEAACPFVNLTEKELEIYRGCGLMYAAVKDGEIAEIRGCVTNSARWVGYDEAIKAAGKQRWCPAAERKLRELISEARAQAYREAQSWKAAKVAEGLEVWKGMFSCCTYCYPRWSV